MTTTADLLTDAFERIRDGVHTVVADLAPEQLGTRLAPSANSISWLVWHLARVQDSQGSDVASTEQVWTTDGWHERFGLPFKPKDTGFKHTPDDVAAVSGLTAEQLTGYIDAVAEHTTQFVSTLSDDDLSRVVDTRWDPPVTLGVRLMSIIGDDLQHLGQAKFVRGLL